MCLRRIYPHKTRKRIGWKLLRYSEVSKSYVTGLCRTGRIKLKPGEWTKDKNSLDIESQQRNYSESGPYYVHYPAGFHIFLNKADALDVRKCLAHYSLTLCKVRFRHQVANGQVEWNFPKPTINRHIVTDTVVAKEIMVVE